jgi:hypothetical protein
MTDVVAFALAAAPSPPPTATPTPPTPTPTPTPTPPADAKLGAALDAARKKSTKSGWDAVLALDADNAEARYRLAVLAAPKQKDGALGELAKLAQSARGDAIEWLVEARFDPAFAALRGDPKFRAAVGLDRKPQTGYERVMGFGGAWMQNGTSCDKAEVHLTLRRDRAFEVRVKTVCEGMKADSTFKGTWRLDGDRVVLTVPTQGRQVTKADESTCKFEAQIDEEGLRCSLGRDMDFFVLPTRR